jgi:hypothetical protein
MIRYFKLQKEVIGLEFVEQSDNQNHHIKIVDGDGVFVIHMMENNPYPNINLIIQFVRQYNPKKLIIDFTSVETYIENKVIEEFENKIKNVQLKILTVNITNNKFKSHIFFPVHAFQLIDTFRGLIDPTYEIQRRVLPTKKRLKKYLFLNHHLRTERFKIFESLHNNNNLKHGLVSFNWTLDTDKFIPQHYSVSDTDLEYIRNSNAYNLLPIELDGNNDTPPNIENDIVGIQNPVYFSPANTNITHYFNVYFEIITEGFSSNTPFHPYVDRTNLLHYSEKIYKPILFGVPFCFWGPENTLVEFKEKFGFRFDCPLYYCNVGYDLKQFCDKINELANLPYEELHKIYYQYIDDIKHNQQTLINYLKNIKI